MVDVKICGISTPQTLQAAISGGADYIGLMFYAPSPRHLSIDDAVPLAGLARGRTKIVTPTVDPDDQLIDAIVRRVMPDYIQCHGSESPARVSEISKRANLPVIKTIKVRDPADLVQAEQYSGIAEIILFDAKAPADLENPLPGGNGVRFDWSMLPGHTGPRAFMLAGGIDAENVAEAVQTARPSIVDVSSGVESSPGIKDVTLIRKFLACAKSSQVNQE